MNTGIQRSATEVVQMLINFRSYNKKLYRTSLPRGIVTIRRRGRRTTSKKKQYRMKWKTRHKYLDHKN
jgi:hypothetical protein